MTRTLTEGRITYTCDRSDGVSVSVSHSDNDSIEGYIEAYRGFLIALGFHPDTVARGLSEDATYELK